MFKNARERKYRMRFTDIDNNYLGEIHKNRPLVGRICWVLLLLGMTAATVYIVYLLLTDYMSYDSYNLEYTSTATEYILPAITLCNVNVLNVTKMRETPQVTHPNLNLYDAYRELKEAFKERESDNSEGDFSSIDAIDGLYEDFKLDTTRSLLNSQLTFSKTPIQNMKDIGLSFAYTESGLCVELNDGEEMKQKVGGMIGGLSLTLDTFSQHYLPDTSTVGWQVTLRMPNETVLSKEFSFSISPGKEYRINLKTQDVTRISAPWGNCKDNRNYLDQDVARYLTQRECYLMQMMWMNMRLKPDGCGCFPWFFYYRFFEDDGDDNVKYDEMLQWRLVKYWTETLDAEYRFTFNDTCFYLDGKPFSTDSISTTQDVASREECRDLCKDHSSCRYFLYTNTDNDILNAKVCRFYAAGSDIDGSVAGRDVTGLVRGDTKCLKIKKCSISAEQGCMNKIMNELTTNKEGDVDENGQYKRPPVCDEPCSHKQFTYYISSSDFPATEAYWEDELKDMVPHYASYEEAKQNLVKLVFYTDLLTSTDVIQTPSYQIQNFIAELGGLTDLLIGLSFYTMYQFIEWIITKAFWTAKKRIRPAKQDNSITNSSL